MNNEKYNQIISDAYKNYCEQQSRRFIQGCTYQEFVEKIKTDDEFAKTWGLKIEERELSLEERYDLIEKDKHKQFVTWQSHGTNRIKEVIDEQGVPTKLITVTYKDERIEIYE